MTDKFQNDDDDLLDQIVKQRRERYGSGDSLQAMPWTRDRMTDDELRAWLASREDAGRAIDIATCELGWWYALDADPYGILEILGETLDEQVGKNRFVRSPESNGWIESGDLPPEKAMALWDRLEREQQAWEAKQHGEPPTSSHIH